MATESEILEALSDLSAKKQIADIYADEFKRRHDEIILKVKPELDALAEELESKMLVSGVDMGNAEAKVKALVIEYGKSVKGELLHAVYAKGKTTWDGAKLSGMVAIIPQIAEACKVGQPSVSIREVK